MYKSIRKEIKNTESYHFDIATVGERIIAHKDPMTKSLGPVDMFC